MKVEFTAAIKNINTKKFVSGDVGTLLLIEKDRMQADKLALLNAMLSMDANKSQELTVTIEAPDNVQSSHH